MQVTEFLLVSNEFVQVDDWISTLCHHADVTVTKHNTDNYDALNYYALGVMKVEDKELPSLLSELLVDGVLGIGLNARLLFLQGLQLDKGLFLELVNAVRRCKERDTKKRVHFEVTNKHFSVYTHHADFIEEVERAVMHYFWHDNKVIVKDVVADWYIAGWTE